MADRPPTAARPRAAMAPPAASAQTLELDLAAFTAAFGHELRHAGIAAGAERCARFARGLALLAPLDRDRVYHAARAIFVGDHAQQAAFDRVFARIFDGLGDPADAIRGHEGVPDAPGDMRSPGERHTTDEARDVPSGTQPRELPQAVPAESDGDEEETEEDQDATLAMASARERLAQREFAELDEAELAAVRRLMRSLRLAPPPRRLRRTQRHRHHGRPDPRATLRRAHRTGGDPVRIVRRRRRVEPRRLVLLCDISGSMESYSRAYLQLLESAVGGAQAEAFTFATRLTRVTRALRGRDHAGALQRAAEAAPDWSGGTRIGQALRTFNQRYARRGMARGAVVVILSDGWEDGDPTLVGREMQRLRRLAYRIVWVNPRVATAGPVPLAKGMIAALPHCDAMVSGHSLAALDEIVGAISAPRLEDDRHGARSATAGSRSGVGII
ncbi:MAG: VWA domain-containing protein [Solirubrobacterales bacterium]